MKKQNRGFYSGQSDFIDMGLQLATEFSRSINQVRFGKKKIKDLGKEAGVAAVSTAGRKIATKVTEDGVKKGFIKAGAKKMARGSAPGAIAARIVEVMPKIYDEVQACRKRKLSKTKATTNCLGHLTKTVLKVGCDILHPAFGIAADMVDSELEARNKKPIKIRKVFGRK